MRIRRNVIWLSVPIAISMTMVGCLWFPVFLGPAITPDRVAQIKNGMTRVEVNELFGIEGKLASGQVSVYTWIDDGGGAYVCFDEKGLAFDFGFCFKESLWSQTWDMVKQVFGSSNSIQCRLP